MEIGSQKQIWTYVGSQRGRRRSVGTGELVNKWCLLHYKQKQAVSENVMGQGLHLTKFSTLDLQFLKKSRVKRAKYQ